MYINKNESYYWFGWLAFTNVCHVRTVSRRGHQWNAHNFISKVNVRDNSSCLVCSHVIYIYTIHTYVWNGIKFTAFDQKIKNVILFWMKIWKLFIQFAFSSVAIWGYTNHIRIKATPPTKYTFRHCLIKFCVSFGFAHPRHSFSFHVLFHRWWMRRLFYLNKICQMSIRWNQCFIEPVLPCIFSATNSINHLNILRT